MTKTKNDATLKGRQTKLAKKSAEELIAIVLKKDAVERKLNNQIVNLKAEVNALTSRVENFDKDMEGTYQTVETLKDKVKTLNEKNDAIVLEAKDNKNLYLEECKTRIDTETKAKAWKVCAICSLVLLAVAIAALCLI